jgi:hypothetical protein
MLNHFEQANLKKPSQVLTSYRLKGLKPGAFKLATRRFRALWVTAGFNL